MKARSQARCAMFAISGCYWCPGWLFLLGWIALAPISAQAQATTLQPNVEYKCGGERVQVGGCHSDRDQPGYPATSPSQDYCTVYYPDRPKRNGMTAISTELRSEIVKKLQACGALAASQTKSAPRNVSANTSAAAYAEQGWKYYQAKDYAKAVEACKKALALDPNYAEAFNVLGLADRSLKQYPDAVTALQRAIQLKPYTGIYHYNLGETYFSAADYAKAIDAYKAGLALKLDTDYSASAQHWIGQSYNRLKQYDLAVPALRQSLALKPDDPSTLYDLGEAYFKLTQYPEAEAIFQQALRLKPDQANSHYYLGWIYDDQKKYAEAVTHLREDVRLNSKHAEGSQELGYAYMQLKQYPEAVAALQQAIGLKSDYAMAHYYLGITYFSMGKKNDAQQVYKTLQTIDKAQAQKLYEKIDGAPNSPPASKGSTANTNQGPAQTSAQSGTPSAQQSTQPTTALDYLKLGDKLGQQGDYAKAIEAYKQGIALKPDNTNAANASNSMGVAYYRLKQYTDAVAAFQQAISFKPDYPQALDNLGFNYNILQQYEKAVPAFREALRLKPDYAEASYLLGVAHFNLKQYEDATSAFAQGIRLKAGDLSQYPDALAAFQEVARLKPDDAGAQYDLGYMYAMLTQYENAVAPLKKAMSLKADYLSAHSQLGVVYFNLKKFPDAAAEFQRAVRLKPDDGAAQLNLGRAYLAMGKTSDAQQVYSTLQPISQALAQDLKAWIDLQTQAEQGDAKAQNTLGYRYEYGSGIPQDKAEALKWYQKAAEQGLGSAQSSLCHMHASVLDINRGVTPPKGQPLGPIEPIKGSKEEVDDLVKWCRKAAEQGVAAPQINLGIFYAKGGEGVKPDYEEAYFWLSGFGDKFVGGRGTPFFEEVAKHLTDERRVAVEKRRDDWKPTRTETAVQ